MIGMYINDMLGGESIEVQTFWIGSLKENHVYIHDDATCLYTFLLFFSVYNIYKRFKKLVY